MRNKQTARKSTTPAVGTSGIGPTPLASKGVKMSPSQPRITERTPPSSSRHSRSQVMNDPCKIRMETLLQTKRKSATPVVSRPLNPGGPSCGKVIAGYNSVKKKPPSRPGEVALREIKRLQSGYNNLIPRSAFHRLVRELTQDITATNDYSDPNSQYRYQAAALEALQDAAESYLVHLFEDSYLCCLHAKRVTLFKQDMALCMRLQRHRGPGVL